MLRLTYQVFRDRLGSGLERELILPLLRCNHQVFGDKIRVAGDLIVFFGLGIAGLKHIRSRAKVSYIGKL